MDEAVAAGRLYLVRRGFMTMTQRLFGVFVFVKMWRRWRENKTNEEGSKTNVDSAI